MTDPTDSPTSGEWAAINPTGGAEVSHYERREATATGYVTHATMNLWDAADRLNALESANAALRAELEELKRRFSPQQQVLQGAEDARYMLRRNLEATETLLEAANKRAALAADMVQWLRLQLNPDEGIIGLSSRARFVARYDALERESGGTP